MSIKDHFTFFLKGKLVRDENVCISCGHCARRCPHKALKMDAKTGWKVRGICVRCEVCIRECPVQALRLEKKQQ